MLTLERAMELAEQVVNERGRDFVYNSDLPISNNCMYVPITDPRAPKNDADPRFPQGAAVTGCLVGEIMKAAGLMTDVLARSTDTIGSYLGQYDLSPLKDRRLVREFLVTLQGEQDQGASWGAALDTAKKRVEYVKAYNYW